MGCSPLLQVVVPQELLAAIDEHIAHIKAMNPDSSITRSAVAREWMEAGCDAVRMRSGTDGSSLRPFPYLHRGRRPRV